MRSGELRDYQHEIEELRLRLAEAEQTIEAIRAGEVDSLVIEGPDGLKVYGLERASNTYRVLMESLSEGAVILNEEGVILYSNGRFARMVDEPLQRVVGRSIREMVPERLGPEIDALLRLDLGAESRAELCLLSAGGEEVPAYISVNVIDDQGSRVSCLVATDLRTQKQNEEIIAAERLARSVLEQAAEAILVCDDQGRIIRASGAAIQLCASNPLLTSFDEAFPLVLSASRGSRAGVAAAALQGKTFRATPATLARPGRDRADVLVSAASLHDAGGRVIGCVVTMVDVTEARRAEQALRESEERLRLALQGGQQGIWDWDLRSNVVTCDDRCKAIFGLSPDAAATFEHFTGALHPEDRPRILRASRVAIRSGKDLKEECRVLLPDGSIRWLEARARLFDDRRGERARMSGTVVDATERKLAEHSLRSAQASAERAKAAAEEATQAKDHFLAVLSHELRTPLTPVLVAAQLMERMPGLSEHMRYPLDVIRRNVQLEARLIDDLLDLTRIAQGKMELDCKPLDIGTVIERAVEISKPDIDARKLHFGVEIKGGPYTVNGDASRLQQVIWNLLSNAVKFTLDGGCVRIRCHRERKRVIIEVIDSGIGIEPEALVRIFNAFEQGGRATTRRFGGLGLGLAIAKRLVEMHEGTISAVSEGRNKGSTFQVSLPLVSTQPHAEMEKQAPGAGGQARRILLVEDNGDTAEMMRLLLEGFGYRVKTAGDVAQALEAIASQGFDLLISDLGLPDQSGLELMEELRRRGDAIKAIALSGYGHEEDVRRSREAGFSVHLTKPVDADALAEVVAGIF